MYRAYRWDAENLILHIQSKPNGSWKIASAEETISYLARDLVQLEKTVVEQELTIEKLRKII